MSRQDSKHARHRQRQAAYEPRLATATEVSSSWRAIGAWMKGRRNGTLHFEIVLIGVEQQAS